VHGEIPTTQQRIRPKTTTSMIIIARNIKYVSRIARRERTNPLQEAPPVFLIVHGVSRYSNIRDPETRITSVLTKYPIHASACDCKASQDHMSTQMLSVDTFAQRLCLRKLK
jgi:hypothetical protein